MELVFVHTRQHKIGNRAGGLALWTEARLVGSWTIHGRDWYSQKTEIDDELTTVVIPVIEHQ